MEHREPLRATPADRRLDVASDSPRESGTFRLRSRDPAGAARAGGWRRLTLLVATVLVTLLALGYLASIGTVAAVGWLHRQSYYQLPFNRIRLEPGPPKWYRGGSHAFLEAVRRSARQNQPIARLDVAPNDIAAIFRNYHWVEDVRVRYPNGGITVELRYRSPVAYVQLSSSDQWIVDEKGTILPPADVDESQLGPGRLTRITGEKLAPPADPTPGVCWKSNTKTNEIPREDRRILAAARLAGYVRAKEQLQSSQNLPALRIGEIIVPDFDDFDRRRLFVLNDERQTIWWRDSPGEERPGEPNADEKWEMLRKWGESSKQRALPDRDYWRFSPKELVPVCLHEGRPHQGKAARDEDAEGNFERKGAGSG
jgi:hypothetical protein